MKHVSRQGNPGGRGENNTTDLPLSVLCPGGTDPSSDPGKPNRKLLPQTAPLFWGSSHQMLPLLNGPGKEETH